MSFKEVVDALTRTYTGVAFALTLLSGLLTIMVERFLYVRRRYKREAAITAVIGWTYVIGGTAFYMVLWFLSQWM